MSVEPRSLMEEVMMFSARPVDMTTKQDQPSHVSPPPLTKLVNRKPSSPREFFEKLYGPDTTKDQSKSPSAPTSPEPDKDKTSDSETSVSTNVNNNYSGTFSRCGPSPGAGTVISPSYLPAFPLPPHEVGLLNCSLDSVPFPGGLAAFCKS